MLNWVRVLAGFFMLFAAQVVFAAPPDQALTFKLKASVVKVHVITKTGGHGVGTGVVVDKDVVATNCHVLANATGVNITKFGDSFSPVAMQADWAHDVCLLRFKYLDLAPVEIADTEQLKYEQPVFMIGFPGGPPKPQITYGKVKALYPLGDSLVVRSDASFIMGASGSPLFDYTGKLVGLSTFKSPGRRAYFYSLPTQWIKALMNAPQTENLTTTQLPFWDAPETERPYFMRVIVPYQNEDWPLLQTTSQAWLMQEPNSAEAHYYLAYALFNLGKKDEASAHFRQAVQLQSSHSGALIALGLIAQQAGDSAGVDNTHVALKAIDESLDAEFSEALK